MANLINEIQNFVNEYHIHNSKEDMVNRIYNHFAKGGKHNCYILNDRYIGIDFMEYQLIRSKKENRWIVKAF